jgi:hypothetical protein
MPAEREQEKNTTDTGKDSVKGVVGRWIHGKLRSRDCITCTASQGGFCEIGAGVRPDPNSRCDATHKLLPFPENLQIPDGKLFIFLLIRHAWPCIVRATFSVLRIHIRDTTQVDH